MKYSQMDTRQIEKAIKTTKQVITGIEQLIQEKGRFVKDEEGKTVDLFDNIRWRKERLHKYEELLRRVKEQCVIISDETMEAWAIEFYNMKTPSGTPYYLKMTFEEFVTLKKRVLSA